MRIKAYFFCIILFTLTSNLSILGQDVSIGNIIPTRQFPDFDFFSFKSGTDDHGGIVLNRNINNTIFGKVNSLALYTAGDRDLNFYSGTGNLIFFPNADHTDPAMQASGNVGIGTKSPIMKLDIVGNTYVRGAPTFGTTSEQIRIGRSDSDTRYHSIYSTHGGISEQNFLQFRVHEGGSSSPFTAQKTVMTMLGNGYIGIGTTDPQNELSVNGTIWAKKVKVQLVDGADWVFEEDYKLPSLEEVEAYIKENKHLPGIPSAEEFRENDLDVAQMDNLLLQKIEELTLYMIDLKKENEKLKEELHELKNK